MNKEKITLNLSAHAELLRVNLPTILVVIFLNSFSVALMNKSDFGMSALSALPFILSQVVSNISFGLWNIIIQITLILILCILCKKISVSYLFSFFLAFCYSQMLNVYSSFLDILPDTLLCHIVYFLLSFLLMCFGINIANNGYIPILPTDLFPRNVTIFLGSSYAKIKTIFDLSFLTASLILCVVFVHTFRGMGLGIGTIICALCTGKTVGFFHHFLSKNLSFPKFHTCSSNSE